VPPSNRPVMMISISSYPRDKKSGSFTTMADV